MNFMRAALIAALVSGLAGCSHKTVSADGTTVTTDEANKTTTITTKEGTATVGKDAVDTAKLGVPIYPGAERGEGALSVAAANGSTQMVTLTTADAFDKVYGWYASQLPKDAEKMKMTGENSVAEFSLGSEAKGTPQTAITISGKEGKTTILIVKGLK